MQAGKLALVIGHLSDKSEVELLTKLFCYDVIYRNNFIEEKQTWRWTFHVVAVMQFDLFSFTAHVSCLSSQYEHANPANIHKEVA